MRMAFIAGSVILLSTALYHFYFARKIIPGVTIGNSHLGGMSFDQAKSVLGKKEVGLNKVLTLSYQDKKFEIKPEEVGLTYNWDATVSRAFEVGRTGNLFIDSKDKLAGLIKSLRIHAIYDIDDGSLSQKLSVIKGEINRDAENATFILDSTKWNVLAIAPSSDGIRVDGQYLYDLVMSSFNDFDFSEKVLSVDITHPSVLMRDLEDLTDDVKKIVFNPLKVTYGKRSWTLGPAQILNLLTYSSENGSVKIRMNKYGFEAYIEELAQEVNELPRGHVTQADDGTVTSFSIVKKGKQLNEKQFSEDFKNALLGVKSSVNVSVFEVGESGDASKYGIFALLGEGKSKYSGSIPGRIHNLTLAAERTSGVLVPPGETYSFNKAVGEISSATGYNQAYIITNGRTVLGEGGGVCQTSTTLFRAILNAGLPITMRYPHAYRVHYYEEESQIGFDASVFQPSLDLQFKNDTANYVLIQSSADVANVSLNFKIYGTPDGRTVEISDPVVTNVSGAPAPLYQDDPTLAKGVVKQVDWSAPGANVYFTRTVKRDGQVLYKDTFSSRYQPWRAIFLVGTKE